MMADERAERPCKNAGSLTLGVNLRLKTNGLTTSVQVSYLIPPHGD